MDELDEYVQSYYDAYFSEEESEEEVLSYSEEIAAVLLLFYGGRNLRDVASLLEDGVTLPPSIVFTPDESEISRVSDDLVRVLTGLSVRLDDAVNKKRLESPELSIEEVAEFVKTKNQYQADRIVRNQDNSISEIAELGIVMRLIASTGQTLYKTWVAKVDSKTCEYCLTMHGTKIPFNQRFVYNGVEITLDSHYTDFANAHADCRCGLKYSLERR